MSYKFLFWIFVLFLIFIAIAVPTTEAGTYYVTATGLSDDEADDTITTAEDLVLTGSIDDGGKNQGDLDLYIDDGTTRIDGDCDDAGDNFYVTGCTVDGIRCTSCSTATGILACKGNTGAGLGGTWTIQVCSGGEGTYTFRMQGENLAVNVALVDFPYSSSSITVEAAANNYPGIDNFAPANDTTVVTGTNIDLNITAQDADAGNSLTVNFYNASDDSVICTNTSVSPGTTVRCNWDALCPTSDHKWYVSVGDGTDTNTSGTYNFSIYDESPTLALKSPENDTEISEPSTILNVTYSDDFGCTGTVTFYNYTDDSIFCQNTSVVSDTDVKCEIDVTENTEVKWYVNASDGTSNVMYGVYNFSYIVTPNYYPGIDNFAPSNDTILTAGTNSVVLNITAQDANGDDSLEVSFVNASDNTIICTNTSVSPGTTVGCLWDGLDNTKDYKWYVNVSDGTDINTSNTYNFSIRRLYVVTSQTWKNSTHFNNGTSLENITTSNNKIELDIGEEGVYYIDDDFNRVKNQNFMENYEGDITWIDDPPNEVEVYTRETDVYIENNKAEIVSPIKYVAPSLVGELEVALTTYESGNVTFSANSWINGTSNRWMTYYTFGQNLKNKSTALGHPDYPEYQYWRPFLADTTYNSYPMFHVYLSRGATSTEILLNDCTGGSNVYYITWPNVYLNYTFAFNVSTNSVKWWVNDDYVGEATGCNAIEKVDSVSFTTFSNDAAIGGSGIPQMQVDWINFTIVSSEETYKTGSYIDSQGWCPQSGNTLQNITLNVTLATGSQVLFRYNSTQNDLSSSPYHNLTTNGINSANFTDFTTNDCIYYEIFLESADGGDSPEVEDYTIYETSGVVNNYPGIDNFAPANDTTLEPGLTSVDLNITAQDADAGNSLTVNFYNASDESVICTNTSVSPGTTVRCNWDGVSHLTDNKWYVSVGDGTDTNTSETYNFSITNNAPTLADYAPTNDTTEAYHSYFVLNVTYSDSDSDFGEVSFVNATDGSIFCTNTSVSTGTTLGCEITIGYSDEIKWYVNATDGLAITNSSTYNFSIAAAESTCTYGGSGDWEIIDEICYITENVDIGINQLKLIGTSGIHLSAIIELGKRNVSPASYVNISTGGMFNWTTS